MTRYLLPNLIAHDNTRVVAACDINPSRLNVIATHIPGVRLFESLGGLWESAERLGLRAVVVAAEPTAHVGIAEEAIAHGVHVFVEKPPALRHELLLKCHDAAKSAGLVTFVGTNWRYSAGNMVARRWVEAHPDVTPRLVVVDATFPSGPQQEMWGLDEVQSRFYEMFIHAADYLVSWSGPATRLVGCRLVGGLPGVNAVLETESENVSGVAALCTNSAAYEINVLVHCSDGTQLRSHNLVDLEVTTSHTWSGTDGGLRDHASLKWEPGQLYRNFGRSGYQEEWNLFVSCIANGMEAPTNFGSAACAVLLIEDALAKLGRAL